MEVILNGLLKYSNVVRQTNLCNRGDAFLKILKTVQLISNKHGIHTNFVTPVGSAMSTKSLTSLGVKKHIIIYCRLYSHSSVKIKPGFVCHSHANILILCKCIPDRRSINMAVFAMYQGEQPKKSCILHWSYYPVKLFSKYMFGEFATYREQ